MTRIDKFIFAISLLMSLDIVLELTLAHLAVSVMPDRYVEGAIRMNGAGGEDALVEPCVSERRPM